MVVQPKLQCESRSCFLHCTISVVDPLCLNKDACNSLYMISLLLHRRKIPEDKNLNVLKNQNKAWFSCGTKAIKIKQKTKTCLETELQGLKGMAQGLGGVTVLAEDLSLHLIYFFSTLCNFSYRAPDALVQPLKPKSFHLAHIYTCRKCSHTLLNNCG